MRKRPPGFSVRKCGRKNGTIALVIEVTKRREPGKHAIEPSLPGRVAHVRLDVVDLDPARGRVLSCQLEESGRSVKPRHLGAALGEAVRDPPVAASEIEHLQPCLQLEQAPDQINLLLASLVREQLRVEVEVIVVECLLALHPLTIAPRGGAVAAEPPLDTTARSAPGQSRCRTSNRRRHGRHDQPDCAIAYSCLSLGAREFRAGGWCVLSRGIPFP